jgi:hypothetical protein
MPDPGTDSGCLSVQTDDLNFTGASQGSCTLTQPTGTGIQTAIYIGSHRNIKLSKFTIDWNEENQTDAQGQYYTGIRSASIIPTVCGGATDIMISEMKFTRAGHRAVDLRGVCRAYVTGNYFFKTGVNVASNPIMGRGNSLSIDMGSDGRGGMQDSYDTWCSNNIVEEHGDSFRCGNQRQHVVGNSVRGAVEFGDLPWWTETGIDAVGAIDSEFRDNYVSNTFNNSIILIPYVENGDVPANVTISGNTFHADHLLCPSGVLPCPQKGGRDIEPFSEISLTDGGTGHAITNITFTKNIVRGPVVQAVNVNGLAVQGNIFDSEAAAFWGYFDAGVILDGASLANFNVTNNYFVNHLRGIYMGSNAVAPQPCALHKNIFQPSVKYPIVGMYVNLCD